MGDVERWSIERLRSSLGGVVVGDLSAGRVVARARGRCDRGACRRLAVAAFVVAGGLWGAAFLFGKLAFTELPVSHVALYRFSIATLVLLPFALIRRRWPSRRDLLHFLLTGFLIVPATFMLQYTGLAWTSATSASLIIGTLPPMLALAAAWFQGERLGGRGWASIGISTLGVTLVVGLPGAEHDWAGDGLVFLSMIVVVAWVLLSKPLIKRYTALVATAYLMFFGTLTMLPVALFWDGTPRFQMSSGVLASVLTLGLACSALTYALWNWGLNHVSASHAGVYTNLEPVVGVLLGVTFLHETLQPWAIIGGLLVIVGAIAITRTESQAQE